MSKIYGHSVCLIPMFEVKVQFCFYLLYYIYIIYYINITLLHVFLFRSKQYLF